MGTPTANTSTRGRHRPALRRSDGGPLVAALSTVAAAGALAGYLLPVLYVVLPVALVAALVGAAVSRELRIRRRLAALGPVVGHQPVPRRVTLPAAPLQIEGGASL